MEKIYILGSDGQYYESTEMDEALKEQVKKHNERNKRDDGVVQEDEGETRELASDDLHGRGEGPVV